MSLTVDERAQLIEDIQKSATFRLHIAEQARSDRNFDIAAAWEELNTLDKSIERRVVQDRTR